MMQKTEKDTLILSMLIPLAAGSLSALLSGGMNAYTTAKLPPASPPAFVFPIVWTILYLLMGVSAWLVKRTDTQQKKEPALKLYAFQLFLNFCWSIVFFRFLAGLPAFLLLLLLIAVLAAMLLQFYRICPKAAYLQIPYFLWCCFAAYLNWQALLGV